MKFTGTINEHSPQWEMVEGIEDYEVYCTGAKIQPVQMRLAGKITWVWAVTSFDNDCYLESELIDVNDSGDQPVDLVKVQIETKDDDADDDGDDDGETVGRF